MANIKFKDLIHAVFLIIPISLFCQISEIPFVLEANKIILPVQVEQSRHLSVILDSGMAFDGLLIYKDQLLDSLGLTETYEVQVGGAGSDDPNLGIVSDSMIFFVGSHKIENQRILVLLNSGLQDFPRDGIIGYSFFGHYGVEINYKRKVITLHNPDSLSLDSTWISIPLIFKDNMIPWLQADINVNGENDFTAWLYIDLASSENLELLIHKEMFFKLPENLKKHYLGRGLSGDITGFKGKVSSLKLGPWILRDLETAYANRQVRSKQKNADGILGNNIFRQYQVIFDYKGKKLYLKPRI